MHPMCDDLVALDENRTCNEYPIEILFCSKCKTAHQRYQVEKHALFPKNYHYRSKHTADVLDGMKDFVTSCGKKLAGLANKKVVDIGCNDGTLLNIFRQNGALTHGIEPTDAHIEAAANGHEVLNAYFTEEVARDFINLYGCADIITFTNVFAHIDDLIRSPTKKGYNPIFIPLLKSAVKIERYSAPISKIVVVDIKQEIKRKLLINI